MTCTHKLCALYLTFTLWLILFRGYTQHFFVPGFSRCTSRKIRDSWWVPFPRISLVGNCCNTYRYADFIWCPGQRTILQCCLCLAVDQGECFYALSVFFCLKIELANFHDLLQYYRPPWFLIKNKFPFRSYAEHETCLILNVTLSLELKTFHSMLLQGRT